MIKRIYSIHTQLIFFYSLTVVTLLMLLSYAFYWETQNIMNQADYSFITDEANNIQSIMSDDMLDTDLLKKAVIDHPVRTRNSLYRYYIRIFDDSGRVFMETPGIEAITSAADSPEVNSVHKQSISWHNYHGNNYVTMLAPIQMNDGEQHGYVQVTLDTSYQHTITHDRRIFIGFLLVGMFLSLLLGKVVTNRGLKSLDILTNTVKTITTSSLDQRVDPSLLPTELSNLGKAFNQMLDRIETSFQRMHQMSADMSHELRTPITNLIGQTEILLAYDHNETELHNTHSSNLEELQRMASLVENILFLSRAESQVPEIDKKKIDVRHEIEKVCDYYRVLSEDKSITITTEGDAELYANPVMFRRLLGNLISNAVKYTRQNGEITVGVRQQDQSVILSVKDNGIGIAAKHIPRLFDRFYRVDDARSAEISGSGLGLSIVKSIVDLHHGSIFVESLPNEGTLFEVAFPL